MDRTEVVVRRPRQDGEAPRVGKVLSRERMTATVQWDDDGTIEENVQLGNQNLLAWEGSLRYLALVDPAELRKRFTDDPASVVVQLLREHQKGLKAAVIKSTLVDSGLGKAAVDKAWRAIQPRLTDRDDIELKQNVYKWKPSAEAHGPDVLPSPPEPKDAPTDAFVTRLARLLGIGEPRPIQDYLAAPLRTAVLLSQLEGMAIDQFLSELEEPDHRALSIMLLAIPRRIQGDPLPPEIYRDVLSAAAAELRVEPSSALRTAAAWLLRRVTSSPSLPPELVGPVIQLALFLAQNPQKTELDALEAAALAISKALPTTHRDLVRIAERLPFMPKGGRTALMAAVGNRWPKAILDERWWAGMTVQELADCAQGMFGRLTRSPEITEGIVRPLLERELAGVKTRARLSLFLGMPSQFAELLPVTAIVEAFKRTGQQDPVAVSWVDALRGQDRLNALVEDAQRAREEAAAAVELAEAAEGSRQELAGRLQRLEEELRDLQTMEIKTRAAQERQIKIDVIRALADLAAEVEELSAAKAAPEIVVERVRGLVATRSLRPIGRANSEANFDPQLHEPIYGTPEPGAPVLVIRPGYVWDELMLQRALVDPKE
ncbi:hypothetical protein ACQP1K_17750 [Sphaerimonospora sp. CA-214678]|uniref:hypothetical protein n=1 Tax=Sphaerimonospora sp. CA-214678 TaxID=3240029 RepID=UPI003D8C079A